MNTWGTVALLATLILALSLGWKYSVRILGEREPLAAAGLAYLCALSLLGSTLNLCLRASLRIDRAYTATFVVVVLGHILLKRAKFKGDPGPPPLSMPERALVMAVGCLAVAPMAWATFKTDMWDEWVGHLVFAQSMANGVYPPVEPWLPDLYLTYHFGSNLLVAAARRLSQAPLETLFDSLSSSLFFAFYLATGSLVRREAGGRLAPHLLPASLLWLGGLAWLRVFGHPERQGEGITPFINLAQRLDGYTIQASTLSFFFQKPMALGLSLLALTIIAFRVASQKGDSRLAVLAGLSLAFLDLCEFPLFVIVTLTTLAFTLGYAAIRWYKLDVAGARSCLRVSAIFLGVGIFVAFLNGSFLSEPSGRGLHVNFHPHFPYWEHTRLTQGSPWAPYLWQIGLPSVMAPFLVAWTLWRGNAFGYWLCLFSGGSFLVPHLFSYQHTNDISKFLNIANIGFALLAIHALVWEGRRLRPWLSIPMAFVLAVGFGGHGLFFLRYIWDHPVRVRPRLALDEQATDWLRKQAKPYDRVLANRIEISALGGFLTPLPPANSEMRTRHMGYNPALVEFTRAAVKRAFVDLNPSDLARLGIKWIYLDENDFRRLSPEGQERLNSERMPLVYEARAGKAFRRIYRNLDGPPDLPSR